MLVCDLDDTLYKEIDFVRSSFPAIGAELARRGLMDAASAERILRSAPTMSKGIDRLMARLQETRPGCDINPANIVEVYRNHQPHISLSPGVDYTLSELKQRGVKLGLITDGRSGTQRAKIRALGLERFFDEENIIISEEIGADKNTPVPFELMMSRNLDVKRFVYVGDNPAKDFYWPNRLKWCTVMLLADHSNLKPQQIELPSGYRSLFRITSFPEIRLFC